MEGLVMTAQLLLALSILVAVHEFGHFLAAKHFKMRVERFFVFFHPWFKIYSKKIGDTEYGIGWLPLGGYVKISGMIDESFDTNALKEEPKEWEFRSKPAWQRLIVMVGGVTMNLILGMLIFIALVFVYGETYLSAEELNKNGIVARELGKEIGLETGDKILAINGVPIERFSDIMSSQVLFDDDVVISVDRKGNKVDVAIPEDFADRAADLGSSIRDNFVIPRYTFTVARVIRKSGADRGGLMKGDRISTIGNKVVKYYDQIKPALSNYKGQKIDVGLIRNGEAIKLQIEVSEDGTIGFYDKSELEYSSLRYGFLGSVVLGTKKAWRSLFDSIKGIGKIISGKINFQKALHGPIGIATIYGGTWNWFKFWSLTAILSMWLAFINIVPIPVLDGGHVVFLLFEMATKRKPSDKFMEVMQIIGIVIVVGLMVFIVGNDIFKIFY